MTDEPSKLPRSWWRRAAARIDGVDIGAVCSTVALVWGLYELFGFEVTLAVSGGLGLFITAAFVIARERAERRRERRLWA